ncbi:MAG: NUDIX domain-containing protein [Oscillospiraceae bacterium]|nr:NUDIX domain-containing protein [Oscillospiraceae bacterium]
MLEVKFYELEEIDDSLLKFAVIVSIYNGKWIYCKHKERETWEIAGGHVEAGETPLETAKRELQEETGAIEFDLEAICIYSVKRDNESYGLLCYATIKKLGKLPDTEIEKISFFDNEPENLTYPDIQPKLFDKVKKIKCPK